MTSQTVQSETDDRQIERVEFEWQGLLLCVTYEADWLGSGARGSPFATSHLTITALRPEQARLPMTETGYRSHFIPQGIVEEMGGALAYSLAWLEHETQSRQWLEQAAKGHQLSLF